MSKKAKHSETSKGKLLPWVTAILMVVGFAVLAAMYWNRNVVVSDIEIVGNSYSTSNEIEIAANVPLGIKPDSLDLEQVVLRVESLDYIKSVTPYIEPNGDLKLTVIERKPIAMLVKGKDEIYVDRDGVRLPILEGKIEDLPLVYGFRATQKRDTLNSESFNQIRDFLIGARSNEFGWATISEVAYSNEEGVIALSHENGVKLLFGTDNFDVKLRNWEAFYVDVIRTKGIQSMKQVDLRFKDQVVTREI